MHTANVTIQGVEHRQLEVVVSVAQRLGANGILRREACHRGHRGQHESAHACEFVALNGPQKLNSRQCELLALALGSGKLNPEQTQEVALVLAKAWDTTPEALNTGKLSTAREVGLALTLWAAKNPCVVHLLLGLQGKPLVCFGEDQPTLLALQFNLGTVATKLIWLGNETPMIKLGITLEELLCQLNVAASDALDVELLCNELTIGTEWRTDRVLELDEHGCLLDCGLAKHMTRRVTLLSLPPEGPAANLPISGAVRMLDLDSHEEVWGSAANLEQLPELTELAACLPAEHKPALDLMTAVTKCKVGQASSGGLVLGVFGPTGSGKSMLAQYLATNAGLPLLRLGPSDMKGASDVVGAKLRSAFQLAESSVLGLLLDDIDLFLDAAGLHQVQERLDRHTGVVLVTSAHPEALPDSFLSRVSLSVTLHANPEPQRKAVWGLALQRLNIPADEQVLTTLAGFDVSLRAIRNLAGLWGRLAPGEALTMDDIEDFKSVITHATPIAKASAKPAPAG